MKAYRYLKNAERWATITGLFFLGVTFASQNLGLTKISICIFAFTIFLRLLLKAKMRSLFRTNKLNKNHYADDYDDFEYVFTWAVVTWTVFVFSVAAIGFFYSLDLIGLDGLSRSIWGLGTFVTFYTLITGIRYFRDIQRIKSSKKNDITVDNLIKKNTKKR